MWSSKRTARNLLLALGLLLPLAAVGGCSFSPVYDDAGVAQAALELNYAKPNSRLEQIVYQELSLRLGSDAGAGAPLVTVAVFPSTRLTTRSSTLNPTETYEATVSGNVTVVRDGAVVASFTRKATAQYGVGTQVLANEAAETDATERAARALAESIRLSLIAALAQR